jgi:NAD(P)H-flavin reductase
MRAIEARCHVKSFKMLTPTVYELCFDTDPGVHFEAGQFVSVVVPGAGPKGRDLRRAYSIASAPQIRPIELCIKLVEEGPGSTYLGKLREGAEFRGFAPYGDFTYEPKAGCHALFIATGTGIAPFRSMVFSEPYKAQPPASAICLLGVRTEDELLYLSDFENLPGVRWVPTVSQPQGAWTDFKGRVTDYLRTIGPEYPWLQTDYYLCGNGAMITEVKALLAEKGVLKDSIHQEKYY